MATFLEVGVLNYFSIIFPALLVFAIVFAVLEKFKLIGGNRALNAIVAIVLAFIVMLSSDIVQIITFISPWFVLVFIFGILLILVYRIMGASEESISVFIQNDRAVNWFIFIIGAIIVIAGISHVYGQRLLPVTTTGVISNATAMQPGSTATGQFSGNVAATFFNPKVLGFLLIMFVAVFSIGLLTREKI